MSRPADAVDAALGSVEADHDVRVLAARDLGSRAWNLADADSDRDVAILFAQEPLEYATLDGYVGSLEFAVDSATRDAESEPGAETADDGGTVDDRDGCDNIDGCDGVDGIDGWGWNVRRFAELVVESNPTAFEFLHSPLRYREFAPLQRLEDDVGESFAPLALYHHYRSLARRQYRKYLQGRLLEDGELVFRVLEDRGDEYLVRPASDAGDDDGAADNSDASRTVPKGEYAEATTDRTVRRHLYVVRGVLYARYVRETHRFPTLDFPRFLADVAAREAFDDDLVALARDLAERKRRGEGDAAVGRLLDPAAVRLPAIDPAAHAGREPERDRVDAFVREALVTAFDGS